MFYKNTDINKSYIGKKHSLKQLQKILFIALLLAGIGINAGFANEEESVNLSTVYHVYSDGVYVGIISDKAKIEDLKKQELQNAVSEFGKIPLTISTDFSIVPERVFKSEIADETTLNKLHEMISVKTEAIGLSINGEVAFYVKNMASYGEVIRELKLQSVTEEELSEFGARTVSTASIPHLKENETRIANIELTSDIHAVVGGVSPKEVISNDQALALLNKGTLEDNKYVVQPGDVLGEIAVTHNMTTKQLMNLNPTMTEDTMLHIGDELHVTMLKPYVEVEVFYESKKREQIKYKTIKVEDSSVYKGEKSMKQQGSDGEKLVTELIRKRNGHQIDRTISDEKVLVEPKDEVIVIGTKIIPSRGTGSFIWPTNGGYISSQMGRRWGRIHQGIDIARPSSRGITVADNGVVTEAGWKGEYGNRVVITHNNGYETLYAHLASIDVKVGQTVPQGTEIGVMGSTGRSTGLHLHFEVFKNGSNINPLSVLK